MLDMENKICGVVTINTKGQILIPSEVRDRMGLVSGDNLICMTKGDKLLGFMKADDVKGFISILHTYMTNSDPMQSQQVTQTISDLEKIVDKL